MSRTSEVDLSLIRRNLDLTPEQRLIEHQRALTILFEIQKAKDVNHGLEQSTQTSPRKSV